MRLILIKVYFWAVSVLAVCLSVSLFGNLAYISELRAQIENSEKTRAAEAPFLAKYIRHEEESYATWWEVGCNEGISMAAQRVPDKFINADEVKTLKSQCASLAQNIQSSHKEQSSRVSKLVFQK